MAPGRGGPPRLSPPSIIDDPSVPPSNDAPPAPPLPARPPSVPALPPMPTVVRPPCPPDPEVVSEPVKPSVVVDALVPPAPSVSKLLEHAAVLHTRRKVDIHVASRVLFIRYDVLSCMSAVHSNRRATVFRVFVRRFPSRNAPADNF